MRVWSERLVVLTEWLIFQFLFYVSLGLIYFQCKCLELTWGKTQIYSHYHSSYYSAGSKLTFCWHGCKLLTLSQKVNVVMHILVAFSAKGPISRWVILIFLLSYKAGRWSWKEGRASARSFAGIRQCVRRWGLWHDVHGCHIYQTSSGHHRLSKWQCPRLCSCDFEMLIFHKLDHELTETLLWVYFNSIPLCLWFPKRKVTCVS